MLYKGNILLFITTPLIHFKYFNESLTWCVLNELNVEDGDPLLEPLLQSRRIGDSTPFDFIRNNSVGGAIPQIELRKDFTSETKRESCFQEAIPFTAGLKPEQKEKESGLF